MTSEDDDDGLEEELLHQDTDSDAAQSSDSDGLLSVLLSAYWLFATFTRVSPLSDFCESAKISH